MPYEADFEVDGLEIRTRRQRHPGGSVGLRLGNRLAARGIQAVMAHPERVVSVQRNAHRVDRWIMSGWRMQLDLLSLVGTEQRADGTVRGDIFRRTGIRSESEE